MCSLSPSSDVIKINGLMCLLLFIDHLYLSGLLVKNRHQKMWCNEIGVCAENRNHKEGLCDDNDKLIFNLDLYNSSTFSLMIVKLEMTFYDSLQLLTR